MADGRIAAPSNIHGWCKTSTVRNKTFNLLWDIEDYKTVKKNHPKDKCLLSQKFSLNLNGEGVQFWLRFFPNGETAEELTDFEENDIALYLNSDKATENTENVKVLPVFSIIDSAGNKYEIGEGDTQRLPYTNGFVSFIEEDELFAPGSKLLKDGTLSFLCEITVKFGDVVCKKMKENKLVEEDTSHTEDMMNMLINAEEHDANIQILCKDGIIPVHSSVLSARSDYFKAMLSSDMEEKRTGKIPKKHLYKSLVLTILEFIYTGKVDPNKISLQLLEESNEMRLLELKKICCKHLSQEINMTNCVQFLVTADRITADIVKDAAKDFIMTNYADLPTKSKKDLESHPSLLSELFSDLHQQAPPAKRQRVE